MEAAPPRRVKAGKNMVYCCAARGSGKGCVHLNCDFGGLYPGIFPRAPGGGCLQRCGCCLYGIRHLLPAARAVPAAVAGVSPRRRFLRGRRERREGAEEEGRGGSSFPLHLLPALPSAAWTLVRSQGLPFDVAVIFLLQARRRGAAGRGRTGAYLGIAPRALPFRRTCMLYIHPVEERSMLFTYLKLRRRSCAFLSLHGFF